MTTLVGKKDSELLKALLAKAQSDGPGTKEIQELHLNNASLLTQIVEI